jgi:hypothetical protein
MKTLFIIILTAGFLLAAAPEPNDWCITLSDADKPRVKEAFGSILGLKDENNQPRWATVEEVEQAMFNWVASSTGDYERRKNMAAFTPAPPGGGAKDKGASTPTPKPKKK